MSELTNLDLSGKVIAKKHPETNALFTIGNNKEWCSIRVESSVLENDDGFWLLKTRSAKIRLQVELAKALISKGLLKDGQGLPIKGQIIVRESFEPFYDGQTVKINPSTGEVIVYMDKPVYRQSIFTSNMDKRDMFIKDYWLSSMTAVNQHNSKEAVPFDKFMAEHFAEPEPCYDEQTI